ncbi:MAG: trypsin-like peptidase domain-containing protein [Clostridia bacterium]|nr:trypsin-like peptidase domain-containing protein [Clostridia bacterium]
MKKTYTTKILSLAFAFLFLISALSLFSACQNGQNGLSAYDIAVQNGFEGSEAEWLDSLRGEDGKDGEDAGNASAVADNTKYINQALMASVSIYCEYKKSNDASGYSAGSGVIYQLDREKGNAYIITNYHVVYNNASSAKDKISENIRVYLYGMYFDGTDRLNETGILAEYVGGSMTYDIAVLKITGSEKVKESDALAIKIADSNKLTPGVTAIAIGNPEGVGISVTSGVVSVESEHITMTAVDNLTPVTMRVIRIDTAVNSGNSGGGLFNAKGQLIGIVNAKLKQSSVENIGYSIPSNVAIGIAQNIIDNCDGKENKSVIKCLIGITVFTTDTRAEYNDDGTITLYDTVEIQSLTETSLAKGVLKAGDILCKVKISDKDEHTICRQFEMIDILLDARVGDTVTITVLREGKEVSFTGTFTEDTVSLVP